MPGKEQQELWVTPQSGGDDETGGVWSPPDETVSPDLQMAGHTHCSPTGLHLSL